jgi:hypothetical protein
VNLQRGCSGCWRVNERSRDPAARRIELRGAEGVSYEIEAGVAQVRTVVAWVIVNVPAVWFSV